MGARVELGFVEAAPGWRLRSAQFPSKVGGWPAWLGEAGLPGPAALSCGRCGQPCAFLLQLYAPLTGRPDAFHRTLLLFCCRRPTCHRPAPAPGPLRAFRNQLLRVNATYPPEPPLPPAPLPAGPPRLRNGAALCRVCGCLAPKRCARCRAAHYCGRAHQKLDWAAGHRRCCGAAQSDTEIPDHGFLFPEYEIVIEPEETESSDSEVEPDGNKAKPDDSPTDGDSQKDPKKHELEAAGGVGEVFEPLDEEQLEAMAKHETLEDKVFQKFKNRIAAEPEQIIRYCRGGEGGPIWVSGENIPEAKDIPNCLCGAKRIFEFQVMPQLLNHLKVDSLEESIDWGTLVVYTCAENCNQGGGYIEEFVWKQDFTADSV
ncbi:PREDICTED: programmed cell death protein 2 isoform X1 [Crocodylus porosus]|uniref:programmed cell death protein 2 isoform X1 n=1 Tax=Crocodylus porosus TaxID=8502 RepID=UPI00093A50FE|nr:PREDICTED: programmed cell death protein 2 isoform X1 [Crocodylus porosus]